jgi:DNA-binding transcriptional MerR regulator
MNKSAEAFRTIGEVADELDVPKHVLRFWEGKFPHIRPMKRGGGRRYYRPEDMELLRGIRHLLHAEGYTIKGVQKILREQGVDQVKAAAAAARAASEAKSAKPQKSRARASSASGSVPATGTAAEIVGSELQPAEASASAAKPVATAVAKNAAPKAKPAAELAKSESAADAKSAAPSAKDIVAAAIRELEICRRLLAGCAAKPAEPESQRLRAARS